jgi:formate dehydrogenase subunit gamma
MTPPADPAHPDDPAHPATITRFDRVERALHWTNAVLFLFLIATGFTLYGAPGTGWIGNKRSVVDLHTYVGFALPIPVLLAIATRAGRQLRADFHLMARWTEDDRRWWRRATKRRARLGKFNPGQKLNAVFIGACIIVMPLTGVFLRFTKTFAFTWRSGADFTHRWFAFVILFVTIGHIVFAISRPESLRGMSTGKVPTDWARREHPRWHAEMTAPAIDGSGRAAGAGPDVSPGGADDHTTGSAPVGASP